MVEDKVLQLAEKLFISTIAHNNFGGVQNVSTEALAKELFRWAEVFYKVAHQRQMNMVNDTVTTRNGEVLS